MTYTDLFKTANFYAHRIIAAGPPPDSGRASFIYHHARLLAACSSRPHDTGGDDAGSRFCRLVVASWADIRDGADERHVLKGTGLWEPLMCEWPMGVYADLAARYLQDEELLDGRLLEVGGGVGNLSRQIAHAATGSYTRSDLDAGLLARLDLPGEVLAYDFMEPCPLAGLDVIVGVNTLHCAADPAIALQNLADALRPGGRLVLAEGAPWSRPSRPWALTWTFGLLDGWWNVGGFLSRVRWTTLMEAAGLLTESVTLQEPPDVLGGLLIGHKPAARAGRRNAPVDGVPSPVARPLAPSSGRPPQTLVG